jgi:hypothetical protein
MGSWMLNRHPLDRLAEVGKLVRELEQEEGRLRNYLLSHRDDLAGDEHSATVCTWRQKHIDLNGLADVVGSDVVAQFTSSKPVNDLRLRPVRGASRHDVGAPIPQVQARLRPRRWRQRHDGERIRSLYKDV